MARNIGIPTSFGYPTVTIKVNGKEYTVETGKPVLVDDAVAEVIENAMALAPKTDPSAGDGGNLYQHSISMELSDWGNVCVSYISSSNEKIENFNALQGIMYNGVFGVYLGPIGEGLAMTSSSSNHMQVISLTDAKTANLEIKGISDLVKRL